MLAYLYLYIMLYIGSIGGVLYVAVFGLFLFMMWEGRRKRVGNSVNLKISTIWYLFFFVGFLFLAIAHYCDGPRCDKLNWNYIGKHNMVLILQIVLGLFLVKKAGIKVMCNAGSV